MRSTNEICLCRLFINQRPGTLGSSKNSTTLKHDPCEKKIREDVRCLNDTVFVALVECVKEIANESEAKR